MIGDAARQSRRVLPAVLAALLGLCLASSGADARPIATGVSYVSESDPLAFERVSGAGGRFVHTWLRWNEVAPAEKPDNWDPADPADSHYDWERVDDWVRGATEAGLIPILQVYYAPSWANRCRVSIDLATRPPCNPDPGEMAQFGIAAARRYSGKFEGLPRVKYWQPQNEPNLSLFFNPQFDGAGRPRSPALYRVLLNRFYDAVKSVDPSNIVISAGLAPNGRKGSAVSPLAFARQLLCMKGRNKPLPIPGGCGGRVKLDVFDMHPYTSGGPTHKAYGKDNVQISELPNLVRLVRAADRAGRIAGKWSRTPVWVSEFSWDSKPPDPNGLAMPVLKRWTAEAVYRAWQAGIGNFMWYTIRDQDPAGLPFSYTAQSGLYFGGADLASDRVKPNLQAFRFPFVAFRAYRGGRFGATFWGRVPNGKSGSAAVEIRRNGVWKRLVRLGSDRGGIFRGWVGLRASDRARPMRAVLPGERSVPFSLKPVKDFFQRPFG